MRAFVVLAFWLVFTGSAFSQESDPSAFIRAVYKNAEMKVLCKTSAPKANCSVTELPQPIQLGVIGCKAVVDSSFCQELKTKEPEFYHSLKRCRPDQFCEDYLFQELRSLKSCKNGFLEGTGENLVSLGNMVSNTATAVYDGSITFFKAWAKRARQNRKEAEDFKLFCDPSINCKRSFVFDIPKFQAMSDEDLDKYSTAILMMEADQYDYTQSTNKRQNVKWKSMGELAEEAEARKARYPQKQDDENAIQAIRDWLKYKGARLECLDAATQAEMICWGAAYIIDPTIVYGATAKFARSAKFLSKLAVKNVVKKEIALEVAEATSLTEHRDQAVKIMDEGELVGHRLGPLDVPNLPAHLRLAKYVTADGREYVAVEQAVRLPSGVVKTSIRELPIDPLTGAFDSKTPSGQAFLDALVKSGEGKTTLAFFDVNNLGYINRNFAKGVAAGDTFFKQVSQILVNVTGGKAQIFRNGGDEFVLVIHESDPEKVKSMIQEVYNRINSKEANQIFREEKIDRAERYRATRDNAGAAPGNLISQLDFARYSRAGVSAGSTTIAPGENLATALARAEDQAKAAKIEMKDQMTIDTTKYGGSAPDPNARANHNFVPQAQTPVPAPAYESLPAPPPHFSQSVGPLNEERRREVYRFGDTTIAEYRNELGEIIMRQETYVHTGPNSTISSAREIIYNNRTQMIEGSHPQGREVLQHFVNSSTATQQKGILRIDIGNLGKVNYYEKGTQAGDELIRATGEVIKQECAKADVPFKMAGGEFVIGLSPNSTGAVSALQTRIRKALANDPAIRRVFERQQDYLKEQIKSLMGRPKKEAEMRELIRQLEQVNPGFQVSGTMLSPAETLDAALARIRR